jgi:hypothetical protein
VRARVLVALAALVVALLAAESSLAAGPPQVVETWVTDVTATSANLRSKLDPEGLSTTYRFEYLTEAAYDANLAAARDGFAGAALAPLAGAASLGAGEGAIAVVQHVGSLAPETAYRYRVGVTNSAGPRFGEERLLTTAAPTNAFPPIDGRGYELVSPVDKDGGSVGAPESIFAGGDFQAAAAGALLTFSSTASFGEAAGAPPASQYVSARGAAGWTTRNVSAPLEAGGYGDEPDGVPFRVFSGDLSRALMLDGARCAAQGTCPASYSLWDGATYTTVPTAAGLRLAGATPDLGHAVFEAGGGLYEWSGGGLETLSATPGTTLAAPIGAISNDGRRVYADQLEDGPIWLLERDGAAKALPGTTGVAAEFQAASSDGAIAFFTVAGHLHRYLAASGTDTDITPSGGVVGVLGISPAGTSVYFQGQDGLERWREGAGTTTIIPGPAIASPSDYPPATATARVSPDGEHLAFLSAAGIPPFDNTDVDTGSPDTELYVYGPPASGGAPELLCASCNPTGQRPSGSAAIPGTIRNGSSLLYRPRVLAGGGGRAFFDTTDRLVVPDTDSNPDVYEWEAPGVGGCARSAGCVGIVSGGRGEGGRFLDASESGDDAFFLTGESLVGTDPGSIDVYDYRVGGGFPEPEAPFVCKGDACQALPNEPDDPGPGTLVPTSGNPPPKVEKIGGRRRSCPAGRHRVRGKRGKSRCVKKQHHRGHPPAAGMRGLR